MSDPNRPGEPEEPSGTEELARRADPATDIAARRLFGAHAKWLVPAVWVVLILGAALVVAQLALG